MLLLAVSFLLLSGQQRDIMLSQTDKPEIPLCKHSNQLIATTEGLPNLPYYLSIYL